MKPRHALAGCAAILAGCTPSPAPAVRGRHTDPSTVPARPVEEAAPGSGEDPAPSPLGAASSSTVVAGPLPATTVEPTTEPTTTITVTTTAKPLVVTPTTTITVPLPEAGGGEMGDVEWLVRQTFPENPDRAAAIAWRESRYQPGAQNGQYIGIMQIGSVTHAALIASMGYTTADLYNAVVNLHVARRLFDLAGWSPWA